MTKVLILAGAEGSLINKGASKVTKGTKLDGVIQNIWKKTSGFGLFPSKVNRYFDR